MMILSGNNIRHNINNKRIATIGGTTIIGSIVAQFTTPACMVIMAKIKRTNLTNEPHTRSMDTIYASLTASTTSRTIAITTFSTATFDRASSLSI